jgi:hypothetical protein
MVREKYGPLFHDPSRVPTFDEKTGLWELSKKFKVEDNDEPDYSTMLGAKPSLNVKNNGGEEEEIGVLERLEKGKLHHPFLDNIL